MVHFYLIWGVFVCLFMDIIHGEQSENATSKSIKLLEPKDLDALYRDEQYEDLAEALQIKRDSHHYLIPYTGEPRSRTGLLHHNRRGDIIFTETQRKLFGRGKKREKRQGLKFDKIKDSKWQTFVHYAISQNFTKENKQLIEDAILDFNFSVQNVMFVNWIFGQKDYVMFFDGDGCSSHIGKLGGAQAIILSQNGCMERGVVQHEMFHTLGMIHEHNRPDRNKYINVLYENIREDWKDQYKEYDYEYIEIIGKYDYLSIMHYPVTAPGNSSLIAIEILDKSVNVTQVGQRVEMTETDVEKLKKLYNPFAIDTFTNQWNWLTTPDDI